MKKLNYLFCIFSLAFVLIFVLAGCKNEAITTFEYDLDGYKYHIESEKKGEACFYIPSNGKEINIPEKINTRQGKYTVTEIFFDYSDNLEKHPEDAYNTKIIIPKTVSGIKKGFGEYEYAEVNEERIDFIGSNVGKISVVEDNPYFDSREDCNCIIETKTDKLILSGLRNSEIPSTVKEIGSFAFWYTDKDKLTIPSNVKKIDSFAFMGNTKLNKLTIEEGVEEIAPYAFHHCYTFYGGVWDDPFREIYIPSTIKRISTSSFFLWDMNNCNIYYNGSNFNSLVYDAGEWEKHEFGTHGSSSDGDPAYFFCHGKEHIFRATIYLYSDEEPEEDGNYWHYVDGVPTIW